MRDRPRVRRQSETEWTGARCNLRSRGRVARQARGSMRQQLAALPLPASLTINPDLTLTQPGLAPILGATVHLPPAPMNDPTVAAKFDALVFANLPDAKLARAWQKDYLADVGEPGHLPAPGVAQKAHVAGGGRLLVSAKPAKTFSAAEDAAFATMLRTWQSTLGAGALDWVLWQEMNTHHAVETKTPGDVPFTPSSYSAYFDHYSAVFEQVAAPGMRLGLDFALGGPKDDCAPSTLGTFTAALTSASLARVKFLDVDYYAAAMVAGTGLGTPTALADQLGVPFGVAEAGMAASVRAVSPAQWVAYGQTLVDTMRERIV